MLDLSSASVAMLGAAMNTTKGANSAVRRTFNACKEQQEKQTISKHMQMFTLPH